MKVSRRSWHWRLHTFFWQSMNFDSYDPLEGWRLLTRRTSLATHRPGRPKNLCRYFWGTVGLSIVTLIAVPLIGAFIVVLFVVAGPFVWGIGKYLDSERHKRRAALEARLQEEAKHPKRPGLLRSFLKAKKSKICPIIELED